MAPTVYLLSAFLLIVAAFIIFRVWIRREYRRKGRLTLFSLLLEFLIFSSFGAFTWADMPPGWPPTHVSPIFKVIGIVLMVLGMGVWFATMAWFGLRRSSGLEVNVLKQTGLYRLSRNPQILECGLAAIGYALLWPSWHTAGWVALFAAIAHLSVLTEEEHLRRVYGEEYEQYCKRVPRYLGFPRKSLQA